MSKRWMLLLPALLAGCGEPQRTWGEVGAPAPEYSAVSMAGDSVSLASLRGEAVLLNVWATWCLPCREEMPDLQELHDEYAATGLRVVGVSIDAAGADGVVREFLEEYGVTYTILRDPGERIAAIFATQGVPVTVLIGPDGTVLWRRLGPVTAGDPALKEALARALPATSA